MADENVFTWSDGSHVIPRFGNVMWVINDPDYDYDEISKKCAYFNSYIFAKSVYYYESMLHPKHDGWIDIACDLKTSNARAMCKITNRLTNENEMPDLFVINIH